MVGQKEVKVMKVKQMKTKRKKAPAPKERKGYDDVCYMCKDTAEFWTGHYIDDKGKTIICGWCSEKCCEDADAYLVKGFQGRHKRRKK